MRSPLCVYSLLRVGSQGLADDNRELFLAGPARIKLCRSDQVFQLPERDFQFLTLDDLCLIVIIQRLMIHHTGYSAAYITQCVGLAIPVARGAAQERAIVGDGPALFAARQACYRPLQYCLVYWLRPVGYRAPLSEVWLVSNTPAPSANTNASKSAPRLFRELASA